MSLSTQPGRHSKEYAVRLYLAGVATIAQLTSTGDMSVATFYRALAEYRANGFISEPGHGSGRSKVSKGVRAWVRSLMLHRPTLYLDEVAFYLQRFAGLKVHSTTVGRWLKADGITLKRLTREARQRDEERRGLYSIRMTQYQPEQLLFADETHFNQRNGLRLNGWAPTRERAHEIQDFSRGGRWTLLGAMSYDGMLGGFVVDGSITKKRFLFWIKYIALPQMSRWPGPRSVLIVDNASVHKSKEAKEMVAQAGCHLIYLPPYSPDYNPIEMAFSSLKARLRRVESSSRTDVLRICHEIEATQARRYFRHCGYGRFTP